ncbi:MAG TPA: hypothetical protein VL463_36935 [Kofleriaceae bacterium]|nr:hypothetical protein [Kofleriaceae bacterium]
MIPYNELVAALERWRVRNGLPVTGGGVPASAGSAPYVPPAQSFAPSFTPPPAARPAPVSAQMPAVKVPARAQTDEPMDLGDADVLDEDLLAPEGGDFAMAFGVSNNPNQTAPSSTYDDEVPDERTAIGNANEPLSPFGSEPGADTYDAEGDVLGEEDDLPPPRK